MRLRQEDSLAADILETVQLPLLALDAELCVETVNDAFLRQFRVTRDESIGRKVYELGNGQWNIPELRRLLSEILPQESTVSNYRVEHAFERIGRRIMHVSARRIERPNGPEMILLAISDDTERESLRAELIGRIEMADKLIDSVREGLLILDPDLRVHSASASFYETFEVEPAQTEGRLVYELGNGQWDIPELRRLLEDVLPRQRNFDDYEVTHVFEDVGERVMLLNGRRFDHQDLILLAIRDITDARQSASRLKEVAKAANLGLFEVDLRSGATHWSSQMRDMLGYPQDEPEPPAGTVPDFVHPEDRLAVSKTYRALIASDGDGDIFHEHRIVRPDGEVRWVQIHGRTEFEETRSGRRPARMRGILLDVTERKAAEAALRESEARYRHLFDAIDEGFCIIEFRLETPGTGTDYRIVEANPAFYERTGLPKSIFGRWLREAAPDLEEHWYEIYGHVARTREPRRFEQKSDMLGRWFDVYAFPIDDPQALRVAVLFNDITERKEAEARQNTLMAELDHRVKNILAVIQAIARQTLSSGEQVDPEVADRLVGRIDALAQSHAILAGSRWEGARLMELVESAVGPYRGAPDDHIDVQGADLNVRPEAAQTLGLALHELVTNAAKHGALSSEAGRLTVAWQFSGEGDERCLVFSWQEQGGPRIEEAPRRRGFGSRLIEQTLAFELDGDVRMDFGPDGLMAVLRIPLRTLHAKETPRETGRQPRLGPSAVDLTSLRGKRSLVVEDEYLVAQETAEALGSAGCVVHGPVGTVTEALRMAVTEDIQGAVLDVNLGGEAVWPAAIVLRARGVPFVFATGYSTVNDMPKELQSVDRVGKPLDRNRLLSALSAAVSG